MSNPTTLTANQTSTSRGNTDGYRLSLFDGGTQSPLGSLVSVGMGSYSDPTVTVSIPPALYQQDFAEGNYYIGIAPARGTVVSAYALTPSTVHLSALPSPLTNVSVS